MPKCIKCGANFAGARCPACGESAFSSTKELNRQLQKYSLLSLAGLFGVLIASYLYPPLDENPPLLVGLGLFFLPLVVHVVLAVSKKLPLNFDLLRRVYLFSACSVVLVAAFLALNGAADRAPSRTVQTSVIRKYASRGRYSTSYHLVVSSWRSVGGSEKLRVNRETYYAMSSGQQIVVSVHSGVFALPWYEKVTPA